MTLKLPKTHYDFLIPIETVPNEKKYYISSQDQIWTQYFVVRCQNKRVNHETNSESFFLILVLK